LKDEISKPIGAECEFIFLRLNVLREYLERELRMDGLPFEYNFEVSLLLLLPLYGQHQYCDDSVILGGCAYVVTPNWLDILFEMAGWFGGG
jgi:hypothetical protein